MTPPKGWGWSWPRALAEFRPQTVVAFGGGSPMDCAKAMLEFGKKLGTGADIRFVAVPTTAGTGSEATLVAVVANPALQVKMEFLSYHLLPDVAVLDPRMTETLPPRITASTLSVSKSPVSLSAILVQPISASISPRIVPVLPFALTKTEEARSRSTLRSSSGTFRF